MIKQQEWNRTSFAKHIGVAHTTLYAWEEKGILVPDRKFGSNRPVYTQAHVDYLKSNGFNLK